MNILFAADVPPDPNSGAAGTEWQTIAALCQAGHQVDAIWRDDLPQRIRHGNLHYLLELPLGYRQVIRSRCKSKQYDVIHVNQSHGFLAAQDHRRLGRPGVFVMRSHGLDDHMEQVLRPWRQKLGIASRPLRTRLVGSVIDAALRRHDRLAYRAVDGVIVSSSQDADFLVQQRGMRPERVACVPQAPSAAFLEAPLQPMCVQRLKRVLHVGTYAYFKGSPTVAAAIPLLLQSHPDLQITWVCQQRDHAAIEATIGSPYRQRLQLLDWMPQPALVSLFDQHGIFLCPSLFEGFGKVFLEAMARGLCVVGTPTGGMADLINHRSNGLLVNVHDIQGLTDAVSWLVQKPAHAFALSDVAAQTARLYSWSRVATETEGFYQSLLALKS